MASVSKWLPNPDWYCKGGRAGTLSSAWDGAVVVVVPDEEEEEEEDGMVMSIGLCTEGFFCVKNQRRGSGTCPGWQSRGTRTCVSL